MTNLRNEKLIKDYLEWYNDLKKTFELLDSIKDEAILKMIKGNLRNLFISYHILLEDFISIKLKELHIYKFELSAIDGMLLLKEHDVVDNAFYESYIVSRKMRNRCANRYKEPTIEAIIVVLRNFVVFDYLLSVMRNTLKAEIKKLDSF